MQVTVNIAKELVEKLREEAHVKRISRSKLVEICIEKYYTKSNEGTTIEVESLRTELGYTQQMLELSRGRIADLQSQLGFLHQQYSLLTQRMLEPPEKIKRRWKFWKR